MIWFEISFFFKNASAFLPRRARCEAVHETDKMYFHYAFAITRIVIRRCLLRFYGLSRRHVHL